MPEWALVALADRPIEICTPVHALVVQPSDPAGRRLASERLAENRIRPAAELVTRLLTLDPAPLTAPRKPDKRLVGTCRHFAVLACALLRYRGIPARVRCGFATYFQRGLGVDHWIVEFRSSGSDRWVRLDPEILGTAILRDPTDLRKDQFLSGWEAWQAYREGRIDATRFGVYGTKNWGPAEIKGNAVRDLAALNKIEMLPWDEWGRMTEAYDGSSGPDYDELLDDLARVCAADDSTAIADLYNRAEFRVPEELIR